MVHGGLYHLDLTLKFGPEDSGTLDAPVTYSAAPGEQVVLSGGRRLTGGSWGEANGQKAWVVNVPEVREGTWRFRQLFVNGKRRPRTRLPKAGEYRIESLPGYTGDFLRSPTKQFVYAPGHILPTWRNLPDVEVVGLTRWLDNRLPIESVDGETRTVTFDRPGLFALVSSASWGDSTLNPSVYWVENVFEALDSAGPWYLDRPQGRLYCLPEPDEDLAMAEIIAPRLLGVLQVVGRPGAPALRTARPTCACSSATSTGTRPVSRSCLVIRRLLSGKRPGRTGALSSLIPCLWIRRTATLRFGRVRRRRKLASSPGTRRW